MDLSSIDHGTDVFLNSNFFSFCRPIHFFSNAIIHIFHICYICNYIDYHIPDTAALLYIAGMVPCAPITQDFEPDMNNRNRDTKQKTMKTENIKTLKKLNMIQ